MAILANRSRTVSSLTDFLRFILITLKHFIVTFLIIASLYIFFAAPKKVSSTSLELVGYLVSGGLVIYETVFKQINLINEKLIYFQDVARENLELKLEIARLKQLQNNLNEIQAENLELKKLLFVTEGEQYSYITTKLVSISLNPFSKTSLIAAGSDQGVEVDQVVINNEGLIGRVTEVSHHYSKILLINDHNSRIPVVTTLSKENGILTGNGKINKIIYLPDKHLVHKGERVVTSGFGHIYPADITVGYVDKVAGDYVVVTPIVDLSKTEYVSILLPFKE